MDNKQISENVKPTNRPPRWRSNGNRGSNRNRLRQTKNIANQPQNHITNNIPSTSFSPQLNFSHTGSRLEWENNNNLETNYPTQENLPCPDRRPNLHNFSKPSSRNNPSNEHKKFIRNRITLPTTIVENTSSEPLTQSSIDNLPYKGRHPAINKPSVKQNVATPHLSSNQNQSRDNDVDRFETNNPECTICCDTIYRPQAVWNCTNCYNMIHLKCIKDWYDKSVNSREEDSTNQQDRSSARVWSCPTCRSIQTNKPCIYKCFCEKVVRPEPKRYLAAHSCGQICGRKMRNCDHFCPLKCHPGSCGKCILTSDKSCFCGKTLTEINCTLPSTSCGMQCNRLKDCGFCLCELICHDGDCEKCDKNIPIICYCGKQEVITECKKAKRLNSGQFAQHSCKQVCKKVLNCGNHYCKEICHQDDCPPCMLTNDNLKTCACGSTSLKKSIIEQRTSCLDPVPVCGKRCNKALICGHKCENKCHSFSCSPCKNKRAYKCICGRASKTIDCSLMFREVSINGITEYEQFNYKYECTIKCQKLKNCKRHKCNIVCCEARTADYSPIHNCDAVCGKKLNCGKHICLEECNHSYSCGDCPNLTWDPISCHCGSSVIQPPITCSTKLPSCDQPCSRQHNCSHPVRHNCYSDNNTEGVGCAPCTFFVRKSCFCGSESKDTVYCYLAGYSCGNTCKKQLIGCYHLCDKICHNVSIQPCIEPDRICRRPCKKLRPCGHICGLPCHGSSPVCPRSECRVKVHRQCSCGYRVDEIDCCKLTQDSFKSKIMMNMMNKQDDETIVINLDKENHNLGPTVLTCNEICIKMKELNSTHKEDKEANDSTEDVELQELRSLVSLDPAYATSIYKKLSILVETAKNSDKRFVHLKLEPANELRRRLTRDLALLFGCSSMIFDEEPYRYVTVRAYGSKSCLPSNCTLQDLLPFESC